LLYYRYYSDNDGFSQADVIDKYLPDEVRTLKTAGELPGNDSAYFTLSSVHVVATRFPGLNSGLQHGFDTILAESVKLNETEDGGDDIEFGSGGEEVSSI
jgi:hypothetical protein